MGRTFKKLAVIVIWAGIGVLAGMQLGGSDTAGNPGGAAAVQQERFTLRTEAQEEFRRAERAGLKQDTPQDLYETEQEKPSFVPVPRDVLLPDVPKPPADVLADKTAGLLQELSSQGIRWVVSLFGSVTE